MNTYSDGDLENEREDRERAEDDEVSMVAVELAAMNAEEGWGEEVTQVATNSE